MSTRKATPDIMGAVLEAKVQAELIPLNKIRSDGGTQMRAALNEDTVKEYAEKFGISHAWGDFPPVVLFYDGTDYWVGDGFHRIEAYRLAVGGDPHTTPVHAEVRAGSRRDAILFAAGANANHGLRRTNADKRRSVETLLRDDEWANWGDREIARACNVTHPFVAQIRKELSGNNYQIPTERTVTRGGTTYTQNVSNIGSNQPQRQQPRGEDTWQPAQETPAVAAWQWHATVCLDCGFVRAGGNTCGACKSTNGRIMYDQAEANRLAEQVKRRIAEQEAARQAVAREAGTAAAKEIDKPLMEWDEADWAKYESAQRAAVLTDDRTVLAIATADAAFGIAADKPTDDAAIDAILRPDATPVSFRPDYDSDEWYTPAEYIEAARRVMGSIDLDPASCDMAQAVVQADVYLSKLENGLVQQWIRENVWINPPYGQAAPWVAKLLAEYDKGSFVKQAIVLLNNMTETGYFQSQVKQRVLEVLSNRDLAGGRRGLFHPDNFTFGQSVFLSQIVAAVEAVDGVDSVEVQTFQRWGKSAADELKKGFISMGTREVALLSNDPNFAEQGVVEVTVKGGL